MPALVEAFGARNGYRVTRLITDDTHFRYILTDIASDRVAARIGFRVTSTAGFCRSIGKRGRYRAVHALCHGRRGAPGS